MDAPVGKLGVSDGMLDGDHDPDGRDGAISALGVSEGMMDGINDPDGAMIELGLSDGVYDGNVDPDGAVNTFGLTDGESDWIDDGESDWIDDGASDWIDDGESDWIDDGESDWSDVGVLVMFGSRTKILTSTLRSRGFSFSARSSIIFSTSSSDKTPSLEPMTSLKNFFLMEKNSIAWTSIAASNSRA